VNTRLVRASLAAAVAAIIGAGFAAPAFAEPAQFCVGLSSDRRGICVSTDWLPTGAPVSPQ